jgi:hypothetical protein
LLLLELLLELLLVPLQMSWLLSVLLELKLSTSMGLSLRSRIHLHTVHSSLNCLTLGEVWCPLRILAGEGCQGACICVIARGNHLLASFLHPTSLDLLVLQSVVVNGLSLIHV